MSPFQPCFRAELGSPSPWELPEETLDHQGLPEGLLLPKVGWGWGWEWGGDLVFLYCSWARPPACHVPLPDPIWAPPFPAGHAVSVYKDLGMMFPFLPDLQLFLLMLCCLGGPLWGGGCPVPPPPAAVPPTPGLYCSML